MKDKKPMYGTCDIVEYLGYREDPPRFICCDCGTIRKGQLIEPCPSCNLFPRWIYTVPHIKALYISWRYRFCCWAAMKLRKIANVLDYLKNS